MKLRLERILAVNKATIGILFVESKFICFTLEDVVRDEKIPHETAIDAGIYEVQILWSPKFQRDMPHLLNVPEFTGILFHWGNSDVDTNGCILVGHTYEINKDWIGVSKVTFEALFDVLRKAAEKITVEIVDRFKEE